MSKMPILYKEKSECCGCGACEAVCPRGSIEMQLDNEGFAYPYIDVNKCVGCMLCIKACPIKNYVSGRME